MAQNESIIASLQANPVPSDRNCVRTGQDVVDLVQDYVQVNGLAGASPGTGLPSTNNTAAQALTTANAALTLAQQTAASVPERRTSGGISSVATGDSVITLSWSPVLPSVAYEVRLVIYGAAGHPTSYYGYRVIASTMTTGSVNVSLDNLPAGASISWVVEAL